MIVGLLLLTSLLTGFGGEDVGTSAFPILRQAFGPRAAALGETFVALSNDASASWWNPAGLGGLKKNHILFSHQEWFLDTRDEYITGVIHTPYGKFSLGVIYSGIQEIESWTEDEEQLESFSTSTIVLQLSYGQKIMDKLSIGVGIKGIYDNLDIIQTTGACLDIGFIYHLRDWIAIGGNLQNIGPSINYATKKMSMPLGFRTGLQVSYFNNMVYLLDINIPERGKLELHSGLEYCILNTLSLRAGFRTGPQDTKLGFLTYGAGINRDNLGVDYAYVPYSVLGSTHRIAFSYSFHSFFSKKKRSGVTIMVVDAYTNVPLKARIKFDGAFKGEQWTNAINGEFHRVTFPEGKTKIAVEKNKYVAVSDSFIHEKKRHTLIKVLLKKPMPSAIIGVIYDAVSKEPLPGNTEFSGPSSGNVQTKENGSYEIGNLKHGTYTLTASSSNYISQSVEIYVGSGELKEKSFFLIKKDGKISLQDIYFDTGRADLRKDAFEILNSIVAALKQNPSYLLVIEGHTDSREIRTKEYSSNWELSKARADAAKIYIIEHFNVDPERIRTEGFADTKPVAPNDTEENLQKNRRVEFIIKK